jgi:hypothetical protein
MYPYRLMLMLLSTMLTIVLLVPVVFSQSFMRQELTNEHARREHAETRAQDQPIASALIPPTCLPAPLPSSPRLPVFTMQAARSGEQVRFDVWREPCRDNSGLIVPLIRATPLSGTPFVCSVSFAVIQAGIQYNNIRLLSSSSSSSSFCDDLLVPATLLMAQFSSSPQFDDSEAFQLIYQGDRTYTLNIPAAIAAGPKTPLPADYDGDGQADLALRHLQSSTWYILNSRTGQFQTVPFGWSALVPVPGDYDGDHKADLTVRDPNSSIWYIPFSSTGQLWTPQFGWSAVVPVPGDYDGDGRTDLTVLDPNSSIWYIQFSSTGQLWTPQFGWSGAVPVPSDYDSDGRTDLAVLDPNSSIWYIQFSSTGQLWTPTFG